MAIRRKFLSSVGPLAGTEGVTRILNFLRKEFEMAIALTGRPTIKSIDRRYFSLLILLVSTATADVLGDALSVALPPQQPINTSVATAQKGDDLLTLEPGKPIERELAGNESHSYQLTLASGQYVRLAVDQRSIDVVVTALGPDSQEFISVDVNQIGNSEEVSLAAETSGRYRLEVRPAEKNAPRGRYEVKIEELRAATGQDKSRVAAGRAFAAGTELYRQGTAESRRKAIERYQESASFRRAAEDRAGEATALYMIGASYSFLGDKQKALDFCDRALPLARAAGDRKAEAYTLDIMGDVHNNFGDKRKALELFNQALPLRRAAGDRVGEAQTLNNMAIAYHGLGERQKALDFFNQLLLIFRELGDRRKEATTLSNICVTYRSLGNAQKALDFCIQALPIKRDLADR